MAVIRIVKGFAPDLSLWQVRCCDKQTLILIHQKNYQPCKQMIIPRKTERLLPELSGRRLNQLQPSYKPGILTL
jgi:hypothetical protein